MGGLKGGGEERRGRGRGANGFLILALFTSHTW